MAAARSLRSLRSLRPRWTLCIAACAVTLAAVLLPGGVAASQPSRLAKPPKPRPAAASPAVTGPVTGGHGAILLGGTSFDLAQVGYEQSEFFLSGKATAYQPVGVLGSDGRWSVTAGPTARYTTRIVVDRPTSREKFNGVVYVEWLNVSFQLDVAPDWIMAHNELIRDGFAWVGVSAQGIGVNAAKASDPVRYGPLAHPGDSYSYDIFSQAGQAVRNSAATILGGLKPHTVLAAGESQSAFRMTTYIDAVHPLVNVFDGFMVHSRGSASAPLEQAPLPDVRTPPVVFIRTDLRVPVLTFETETDLLLLNFLAARQDDSASFRLWEVAGTAHADTYTLGIGFSDTGTGPGDIALFNSMLNPPSNPLGLFSCPVPINAGEQHYVFDTAVRDLGRWARNGDVPPRAAHLRIDPRPPASFRLDSNGNVEGGIRTPAVDVPVAKLSGLGQSGGSFCFIFGTTVPFDAAKLANLYPTHHDFVRRWDHDTRKDVRAGFILPFDGQKLEAAAAASNVRRP